MPTLICNKCKDGDAADQLHVLAPRDVISISCSFAKEQNETHGYRREHVELMTSCNEWVGFNPESVAKAHYVKVF